LGKRGAVQMVTRGSTIFEKLPLLFKGTPWGANPGTGGR